MSHVAIEDYAIIGNCHTAALISPGLRTPLVILAAHLIYGLILGAFYELE